MAKRFTLFILFILLLSIPAVWPIVAPGFFPVHDDAQAARVQQMYAALRSGQFPVRWVPDLGYGYGYPVFNFYNPLPYYFGAGFMLAGFDVLTATKIMYVFPVLLSGIAMFIFAKLFLTDLASLLAGILYVYAPYHAVQIYVRGAVAEYWAYAILPLVFYALWKKKIIVGILSLVFLILSHNLTSFMSIPFIILLICVKLISEKKKTLLLTLYFLLFTLALGASALFWLPSILESGKTGVDQMVFEKFDPPAKHVAYPLQLWSGVWGYGGSSPGIDDGLSFQLGKIHLLGSLAAIAIWLYVFFARKTINNLNHFSHLILFAIIGLFFSLFMILPFSRPIWDAFPVLAYIQFPWRFLTFASLFSSILTAGAMFACFSDGPDFFSKKIAGTSEPPPASLREALRAGRTRALATHGRRPWEQVSVVLGLSLLITLSLPFFQPKFKFPVIPAELISREKLVWDYSKISDEYLPKGFAVPVNAEVAMRVDNKQNQLLVDQLKQPTAIRETANLISLFTVISFITFIIFIPFKKHGQNISG